MFADFMDGAYIDDLEQTLPAPPYESVLCLGSRRQFIWQEFERRTAKLILSLINHTHAATTELLNDAIVRDGLADHESRYGRRDASMKAVEFARVVGVTSR